MGCIFFYVQVKHLSIHKQINCYLHFKRESQQEGWNNMLFVSDNSNISPSIATKTDTNYNWCKTCYAFQVPRLENVHMC